MRWIHSTGGPLLLVPTEHVRSWEGIDPPPRRRQVVARFRWAGPDAPATDYDRACDVDGWLGVLEIGSGHGVVLGDEPMGTTWQASGSLEASGESEGTAGGLLVRWMYADSEAEALRALQRVPETAWRDDGIVLEVGGEGLCLMDAATPRSELADDDHLTIHLPPGTYAFATAEHRPDSQTSLVLHRLTRRGSAAHELTGR